jgi:hypothetical protein
MLSYADRAYWKVQSSLCDVYLGEEAEEGQHCSLLANLLVLTWSSWHCTLIAKDMQGLMSKSDAQITRLLVSSFHT